MTSTPEIIDLHPVPHPQAPVRQVGFPLDHPYVEHCWTPVIGPSSVLLLRRCSWLWRDAAPASVSTEELAGQLGLARGTGRNSPIWHTVERIVRFRFAAMPSPGELHVYTEVSPLPARQLERLPGWCRDEHERLFGQHLDGLARAAGQGPTSPGAVPPAHLRMARRLDQLAEHTSATARPISR